MLTAGDDFETTPGTDQSLSSVGLPIIGSEAVGVVEVIGPDVTGFKVGDRVCALVAGGGTGDATIFLAEQLRGTNAEVVHLDMSQASIALAQARAQIRGLDNITWVQKSRGMLICAGAERRLAFMITRFSTSATREASRTSS